MKKKKIKEHQEKKKNMFRLLTRSQQRRHHATTASTSLWSSMRTLKSRSLQPDDPFGEKASWEDPEELITPWRDVNQGAFAAAASSDAVQNAHFGPLWSRFATVGRLAVKAAGSQDPSQESPSTEELHAAELARKQDALKKNYSSYEEFVAAEMSMETTSKGDAEPATQQNHKMASREGEALERAVLGEGDVASSHRMLVRAAGSAPLSSSSNVVAESLEEEESPALPGFMLTTDPSSRPLSRTEDDAGTTLSPSHSSSGARVEKEEDDSDVFPLLDPKLWTNDLVIDWLCAFAPQSMDDAMVDAFRMVRVDGDMLLNKVTPNVLFKTMRRWHLKRAAAVQKGTPLTMEELKEEAKVTDQLVQETIYLCYPYCR